jgi:hypothetical protein
MGGLKFRISRESVPRERLCPRTRREHFRHATENSGESLYARFTSCSAFRLDYIPVCSVYARESHNVTAGNALKEQNLGQLVIIDDKSESKRRLHLDNACCQPVQKPSSCRLLSRSIKKLHVLSP